MSLISIKHENGLRVSAGVGQHKLVLDVPIDQGRTDAGPTPVELLAAALGACMAMHIAKYCKAARLPYEGFGVDLDFQLAKDPLRIGSLAADITPPPGFPEDRKDAIKRPVEQCTVKNTLKESTAVDVEIWTSPAA
jgi:putative redox protein